MGRRNSTCLVNAAARDCLWDAPLPVLPALHALHLIVALYQ